METKIKLNEALKEALKSGDDVRKGTVRMVLAAIKQAEVDRQVTLDEQAIIAILQKEIKLRREALEEATSIGRTDLISAAVAEIKVLQVFLPEALSAEELRALVSAAVAETGASSITDMGKVMKVLMPRVAGRAPGDQLSAAVREILQK
jgi:uncharacterized protein YqeY